MDEPGAALDVLVAGYASIDFVWHAAASPGPGRTVLLTGPADAPPRFGGAGPYVALDLADLGRSVALVSWLGDDSYGQDYLAHLATAGVDTRGVVVAAGKASPRSLLFYDPDGSATCCYHPSGSRDQTVDQTCLDLLAGARAVALTVAPEALTEGLLTARPAGALLAWSVKADPDAYPVELRRRLLAEADLICMNRDELDFLLAAVNGAVPAEVESKVKTLSRNTRAVVVVTAGAAGAQAVWPDGEAEVCSELVSVGDPTGAGDAFFAAFLSATLGGAHPCKALRAATDYVARFLRGKAAIGGSR